ncbi:hypothetical protein NW768_004900 [Fusarium equiseti]|uniref:Tyrosine-protein kinase catalytic domain-containing protein n=1 Tax=Fusarium equiseti TaxID=61235 RepID=A0ABQ8RHP1_FUSEQ|nr:hypothetical protein NW768_004900 [Fusarium equiseti]
MYDHAALAEDNDEAFKREAAIYDALGSHEHILKSFGLAYPPAKQDEKLESSNQGERHAWALKLERAPHGNLRERIIKGDAPPMTQRLKLAGDISTRNVLLFDDLHVKLSDFAGSSLKDSESPERTVFGKEMFALGTCICEITEWAIPYGEIDIAELQQKLMNGEYPHISDENPVKHVIQKLWNLGYLSVQEASIDLVKVVE